VDNSFSIAADAGGVNVTVAEFDAIVAQETPGPSGPPANPCTDYLNTIATLTSGTYYLNADTTITGTFEICTGITLDTNTKILTNNGTIVINGTLNINSNFINSGILNNNSSVVINSSGNLYNSQSGIYGTINNSSGATISMNGTGALYNTGATIVNNGKICGGTYTGGVITPNAYSPSCVPPTLTFTFNGSGGTPLNISTIPAGYTSLS
jgi:hypothetical protein